MTYKLFNGIITFRKKGGNMNKDILYNYNKILPKEYDKPEFVNNYKIDGSNIIVNMNDKEQVIKPYSRETEEELLKKMKEQAELAIKNKWRNHLEISDKVIMATNAILVHYYFTEIFKNPTLFSYIAFGWLSYTEIEYLKRIYMNTKINKEIEKFEFYLDNKEYFDEKNININDIDGYTLKLVKQL